MSKNVVSRQPRFKKQRRLGMELPGLGKSGALDRKPYPPGQHGNQRRKLSEYALRLEEKQKILVHYGIREEQLRRFVRQAKQGQSADWVDKVIGLLERRLDNVVFRLGFAPSVKSARQMVAHGNVLVNGKRVTIGSQVLRPNDQIALESYQHVSYMQAKKSPRLEVPDYLSKEPGKEKDTEVGVVKDIPHATHIPFPFETGLLAEYYAARSA
ncbi:MAG: 30S ribosomal protein S4 [Proteobacteria bacterium]|jgi:small subunit ribosomal protein S4|nr:30S ribosomal protein S4 [Pseudomonadota bacterium]